MNELCERIWRRWWDERLCFMLCFATFTLSYRLSLVQHDFHTESGHVSRWCDKDAGRSKSDWKEKLIIRLSQQKEGMTKRQSRSDWRNTATFVTVTYFATFSRLVHSTIFIHRVLLAGENYSAGPYKLIRKTQIWPLLILLSSLLDLLSFLPETFRRFSWE